MKPSLMRNPLAIAACSLAATPVFGAGLDVSVQIPQLDVAEYHRPYVAIWLEREDRSVAANLAVWYQLKRGGMAPPGGPGAQGGGAEGGTKWLPDLRQWWRRIGRELTVPIDGVTGATRPVGQHELNFSAGQAPLGELAPGQYKLVVEAAREEGGREVVDIPFEWPSSKAQQLKAQGRSELGAITLAIKP